MSGVTDRYVFITCDDSSDRRTRAAHITAAKRAYQRQHGVILALDHKTYSEQHGFLSRSVFRYALLAKVGR